MLQQTSDNMAIQDYLVTGANVGRIQDAKITIDDCHIDINLSSAEGTCAQLLGIASRQDR